MKQQTLFTREAAPGLTIDAVATELSVSSASVRNWLRLGYLARSRDRLVDRHSLDQFVANVAGVDKLTGRANKRLVDKHDHAALQAAVRDELETSSRSGDEHSAAYEASLSDSFRNKEGIYYTPQALAGSFFHVLPEDRSQMTFCDPCCGTGNYLIAAVESGFSPHRVFGFDTDATAVAIAKRRMLEKTGIACETIDVADFLQASDRRQHEGRFDVVFTNPPWGKKLPKSERQKLGRRFGAGKSIDTCSLFHFAAAEAVREEGYLGMLLPDAFFNIGAFEDVRRRILSYRILSLADYGRPFSGLLTRAKGVTVRKVAGGSTDQVACRSVGGEHLRTQRSFAENPKAILNLSLAEAEDSVIRQLFARPHMTLKGNARWGLGIVTGNNRRFVRPKPAPGYVPVYRGADIQPTTVAEPTAFIPSDLVLYQQVAPREMYEADEKLIYRFISSRLIFFHDTRQRLLLNSANLVIPDSRFPVRGRVLAGYFSGKLMNWLFASLFETHKVLRCDIEHIPVFHEVLAGQETYDEDAVLNYLGLEETPDGSYRART